MKKNKDCRLFDSINDYIENSHTHMIYHFSVERCDSNWLNPIYNCILQIILTTDGKTNYHGSLEQYDNLYYKKQRHIR